MSTSDAALAAESRVPQILIGTIVPTIIGSIFVVAKLYTRVVVTQSWGSDDTFLTIGWLLSIGLAALNCILTKYGAGHHTFLQTPSDIEATLKIAFSSMLFYQLSLSVIKMGICTFYIRIFQDKTSKYLVYGIIGFVVLTTIPAELITIFHCNPVSGAWDTTIQSKCVNLNPEIISFALFNILGDLALIAFAIPRVLPLKMVRRQKISLVAVASIGFLAVIAAIVRLCRALAASSKPDMSWHGYDVTTWSSVEVATCLFCSSAPCLRPLIRKMAPGFMSSVSGATYSGPSNGLSLPFSKAKNTKTGTHLSTRVTRPYKAGEGFELHSSNGIAFEGKDNKSAVLTNTFWVGRGEGDSDVERNSVKSLGRDDGDDDSERGVFEQGKDGNIVKTVSILVHHHGEDGSSREKIVGSSLV